MKLNKIVVASTVLAAFLLTGCVSATPSENTETSPVTSAVATTPVTETTSPVTTMAPAEATEAPTEPTDPFEVKIIPVITEPQNQVTVTTVDEFLAAIAPNTEIIVAAELIDMSKATGYGEINGEYYYWADAHDGPELFISKVSNLTIRGQGEDHNTNVISSVPRYSNVLNFSNCSNIMIKGLTAGHTEEPGYCQGGVLHFQNCENVLVEDCGLFGCGTLGVIGFYSKDMQIVNNDIYECTVGGVELTNCGNVNVDGNTFRDLGGPIFRIYNCENVTCNGESTHQYSSYY